MIFVSCANAKSIASATYPVTVLSSDLHRLDEAVNRIGSTITPPVDDVQLQLSAMGRDYTLNLRPSHLLLDTQLVDITGTAIAKPDEIFLQGTVEGDPWSWVRGTWSGGVFTGWLYAYEQLLAIERSDTFIGERTDRTVIVNVETSIAAESGYDLENYIPEASSQTTIVPTATPTTRTAAPYIKTPAGKIDRALRIGIVVDSHYNKIFDGQGLEKALSIINIINGIYQQELGVAIKLETAYLFNDSGTDPLNEVQPDINAVMSRFRTVRMALPQLPSDLTLVHLFTGLSDPQDILGLGWIDAACRSDGYDVSVSRPFRFDALLTAHEIAHNLGAVHDNNIACTTETRKIMSARLTHTTGAEFSDCSRDFMAPLIAADCNLDNLDLAIDLRESIHSSRTEFSSEQKLSLLIQNTDDARTAEHVVAAVQFSDGVRIFNMDSRCRFEADQVVCKVNSLEAGTQAEFGITISMEPGQTGEAIATLRPKRFSDVTSANNTASLRFNSIEDPAVSTAVNDKPAQVVTSNKTGRTGGSLVYLLGWLSLLTLIRNSARVGDSILK